MSNQAGTECQIKLTRTPHPPKKNYVKSLGDKHFILTNISPSPRVPLLFFIMQIFRNVYALKNSLA